MSPEATCGKLAAEDAPLETACRQRIGHSGPCDWDGPKTLPHPRRLVELLNKISGIAMPWTFGLSHGAHEGHRAERREYFSDRFDTNEVQQGLLAEVMVEEVEVSRERRGDSLVVKFGKKCMYKIFYADGCRAPNIGTGYAESFEAAMKIVDESLRTAGYLMLEEEVPRG